MTALWSRLEDNDDYFKKEKRKEPFDLGPRQLYTHEATCSRFAKKGVEKKNKDSPSNRLPPSPDPLQKGRGGFVGEKWSWLGLLSGAIR